MKSYNHERFIAEAIESVTQQDFKDLELIIVDDASTDASRQVIERYAERDCRSGLSFATTHSRLNFAKLPLYSQKADFGFDL